MHGQAKKRPRGIGSAFHKAGKIRKIPGVLIV